MSKLTKAEITRNMEAARNIRSYDLKVIGLLLITIIDILDGIRTQLKKEAK